MKIAYKVHLCEDSYTYTVGRVIRNEVYDAVKRKVQSMLFRYSNCRFQGVKTNGSK